MHESESNFEDEDQGSLEEFVFLQHEKNDKAQKCDQALCNKLKLNAIKKIQGRLLWTHKNKTRQDNVATTHQVTFKKPKNLQVPLRQTWKAACLLNAQGRKVLS